MLLLTSVFENLQAHYHTHNNTNWTLSLKKNEKGVCSPPSLLLLQLVLVFPKAIMLSSLNLRTKLTSVNIKEEEYNSFWNLKKTLQNRCVAKMVSAWKRHIVYNFTLLYTVSRYHSRFQNSGRCIHFFSIFSQSFSLCTCRSNCRDENFPPS